MCFDFAWISMSGRFLFTLLFLFCARPFAQCAYEKVCDEIKYNQNWKFTGLLVVYAHIHTSARGYYVAGRLFLVISHQHSLLVHSYFCSWSWSVSHSYANTHTHAHTYTRQRAVLLLTLYFLRLSQYLGTNNAIRFMGQMNVSGCIKILNKRLENEFSKTL